MVAIERLRRVVIVCSLHVDGGCTNAKRNPAEIRVDGPITSLGVG